MSPILKENNYEKKINSFTKADWKPLLDLIPIIENTQKFGEVKGGEIDEDGVMSMPSIIMWSIKNRIYKLYLITI